MEQREPGDEANQKLNKMVTIMKLDFENNHLEYVELLRKQLTPFFMVDDNNCSCAYSDTRLLAFKKVSEIA